MILGGSNLESYYDRKIPKHLFPTEYLPDDYTGPNNGSVNDLVSEWCLFLVCVKDFWILEQLPIQNFISERYTKMKGNTDHIVLKKLPELKQAMKLKWNYKGFVLFRFDFLLLSFT